MMRNGRQVHGRIKGQQLSAGDVLMIRTSTEEIVSIRQETGVELHPVQK
jgi:hypothetical protein